MAGLHPRIAQSISATKVTYRRLGSNTGLLISVPIMGCMSFGDKRWAPWVLEEAEALPVIKAAWDRGINTWDTANTYGAGRSEMIVGKALKEFGIERDRVVILTKVWGLMDEKDPGLTTSGENQRAKKESRDFVNRSGLTRSHIFKSVNDSLRRLDTDYIDVLQIHRFDYNTPIEETMLALHDVVRSGKVRYIGASSMWTYQFARMQALAEQRGWTKFVSMQNCYSLLYREEEREMNRYCNETGVALIPWAPLAAGVLSRPIKDIESTIRGEGKAQSPTRNDEIIRRVEEVAEKKGWTMSQVALAWVKKRVTSPIVGFSKTERIEEAVGRKGEELTDDEEKYLMEPYKPLEVMGHT